MSDPFKKPKAASKGAAKKDQPQDAGPVSAEALLGQVPQAPVDIVPEPEVPEPVVETPVVPEPVIEPELPKTPVNVVVEVKIEKPVDVSSFSKQEAIEYIKKQFQAKIQVDVIAKEDGEHPKSQWKKAGQKFKLESVEAYSHRWMKLA
jgi:hypothetical protein